MGLTIDRMGSAVFDTNSKFQIECREPSSLRLPNFDSHFLSNRFANCLHGRLIQRQKMRPVSRWQTRNRKLVALNPRHDLGGLTSSEKGNRLGPRNECPSPVLISFCYDCFENCLGHRRAPLFDRFNPQEYILSDHPSLQGYSFTGIRC